MLLISANPHHFTPRKRASTTGRKAKPQGAKPMAKRHRSAAQKAATRKMLAANRRHKTHRNPTARKASSRRRYRTHSNPVARRRRTHRNPSLLGGGGLLGELLSVKGAVMVGAAFAAPIAASYLQNMLMPTATGWTKVAVKAAIVVAGAWALDKFVKQRNAALAFGVTGLASCASDAYGIGMGALSGLSADQADMIANRPDLIRQIAGGQLGSAYSMGLASPYSVGMADDNFSLFNGDARSSGFAPSFPNS